MVRSAGDRCSFGRVVLLQTVGVVSACLGSHHRLSCLPHPPTPSPKKERGLCRKSGQRLRRFPVCGRGGEHYSVLWSCCNQDDLRSCLLVRRSSRLRRKGLCPLSPPGSARTCKPFFEEKGLDPKNLFDFFIFSFILPQPFTFSPHYIYENASGGFQNGKTHRRQADI